MGNNGVENRYRKGVNRVNEGEVRRQYERAREKQSASSKQMTYDDYLEQIKDVDKIIELDEDSRLDKAKDVYDELKKEAKSYAKKKAPVVKAKAHKTSRKAKKLAKNTTAKAKNQRAKISTKQQSLLLTSLVVLVLSGYFVFGRDTESSIDSLQGEVQSVVSDGAGVPTDFTPVTPGDLTDSQAVRFDSSVGIASFQDFIQGNTVTVSQQPLSDEQKADPETTLSEIGVALFAGITLQTNKGSLYLTTPVGGDDPSQTGIFIINDLLVFIRTRGVTINNDAWVRYVNSL